MPNDRPDWPEDKPPQTRETEETVAPELDLKPEETETPPPGQPPKEGEELASPLVQTDSLRGPAPPIDTPHSLQFQAPCLDVPAQIPGSALDIQATGAKAEIERRQPPASESPPKLDDGAGSSTVTDKAREADDALHRYDDLEGWPKQDRGTDAWADDVHSRHPELTPDAVKAVAQQTGDDTYRMTDSYLRGRTAPATNAERDAHEGHVALVTDGLAEMPAYHGVSYRATNVPNSVLEQVEENGTYEDNAFFSTSLNPNIDQTFGQVPPGLGETPVMFMVDGNSGRYVENFSRHAGEGEEEVMFPPGTSFEVLGREWDSSFAGWNIFLRERR